MDISERLNFILFSNKNCLELLVPLYRVYPGDCIASIEDCTAIPVVLISKLSRIDLSGADLENASLSNTDLSGTDLSGSDLRNADLTDSELRGVDLSFANMKGATGITFAQLENQVKSLTGAIMPDGSIHP